MVPADIVFRRNSCHPKAYETCICEISWSCNFQHDLPIWESESHGVCCTLLIYSRAKMHMHVKENLVKDPWQQLLCNLERAIGDFENDKKDA